MDVNTLASQRDQVQILDVRSRPEWQAGHIEGALHIPQDELPGRLHDIDRSRPLVAVCRTGARSGRAAAALAAEGVDVANLEGGLAAWAEAGFPLQAQSGGPGVVAQH